MCVDHLPSSLGPCSCMYHLSISHLYISHLSISPGPCVCGVCAVQDGAGEGAVTSTGRDDLSISVTSSVLASDTVAEEVKAVSLWTCV